MDIKQRIANHKSVSKKIDGKLYRSINKYGWDAHNFEIIEQGIFDNIMLDTLETKYILEFNCFTKGLNMTKGGGGVWGNRHSDEFKEKHRIRMTGENNPFYGKKHSIETIEKDRIKKTGKTLSKESRLKVGIASKGNHYALGHIHSAEALEKMANASKGNSYALGRKQSDEEKEMRNRSRLKPVFSSVLNRQFQSVNECADFLGIDNSTICNMFTGIVKNRFGLSKVLTPKVKCIETGKEYFTIRDAAKDAGVREALLGLYLKGKRNNRTSMRFL